MPQYARPSADTLIGPFVDEAACTTDIFAKIGETTANDSSFIISPGNPNANVYVCKLSAVTDPVSNIAHIVNIHYQKSVDNSEQLDLVVDLYQDYVDEAGKGDAIANATFTDIPPVSTANSFTLTIAQSNTITHYANLFLRFEFNKP